MWLKIALNAVRLPKFEPVNGYRGRRERSWSKIYGNVPGWRDFVHAQRAAWSLTRGLYTVLPHNSILTTANVVENGLSK